jgi:hypothetical protein
MKKQTFSGFLNIFKIEFVILHMKDNLPASNRLMFFSHKSDKSRKLSLKKNIVINFTSER